MAHFLGGLVETLVRRDWVVGPGGLEPATRRLSAPAGKVRIRRAQTRHRRWSQKGLAFCYEPSGSVVRTAARSRSSVARPVAERVPAQSAGALPRHLLFRNTLDFPRFGAGVMARSRSLRETKTVRKRIGARFA